MNFEQRLNKIKPHPRKAIANIPIMEICELMEELYKKVEKLEDKIDELESKVWTK